MAKGFANIVHKAVENGKENGTNIAPSASTEEMKKTTKTTTTASAGQPTTTTNDQEAPQQPSASTRKETANANWDKVTAATKLAGVVAKNQRANAGQKLFTRTVVSATTWEIFSPPPSNSVSGKIVPRVLNRYKNRRRVSIEVHRITPHIEEQSGGTEGSKNVKPRSYEECVLRWVASAL
jgi:hypothetical protein